ncbi:MAG: restriction endonuclease subunit S [Burkholderiales bacterium]
MPVPVAPIETQRKVAAYLDEQLSRLDAGVAALLRAQANLKRYRASVLKAACEGRLVPTEAELARAEGRTFETGEQLLQRILAERRERWSGKGKYKEPAAPDTRALQSLPAGWVWASLDQLFDHVTDGDHQAPPQTDEGIPFLVIGNVRSGTIDLSDTRFVGQTYYDSLDPRRKPARGDILYTLVGSYGIAAPVETSDRFCIQRHMAILRPHGLSPARYLAHALGSDLVFKQATGVATGTAQMTVPLAGLRRIGVGLPPLAEQHRIVAEADRRLSLIRGAEAQVSANLARAKRLRQSILQAAFASPGQSFK